MAAIHTRAIPLLNLLGICHTQCYRSLPKRGRLPREVRLNPEAEQWLSPALRERAQHMRELEFQRDYMGPVSSGVCLG